MKKIIKNLMLITVLFTGLSLHAQTTQASKDSVKAAKKAARAEKKAEKAKAASVTAPAVTPAPQPTPVATTAPVKTVKQAANKSADKAVGTDAKGRTIYEGKKGGHYVLTAAGNKEYIKKTN